MDQGMQDYERQMLPLKEELIRKTTQNAQHIVEIGVGTGVNLQFYPPNAQVCDARSIAVYGSTQAHVVN